MDHKEFDNLNKEIKADIEALHDKMVKASVCAARLGLTGSSNAYTDAATTIKIAGRYLYL